MEGATFSERSFHTTSYADMFLAFLHAGLQLEWIRWRRGWLLALPHLASPDSTVLQRRAGQSDQDSRASDHDASLPGNPSDPPSKSSARVCISMHWCQLNLRQPCRSCSASCDLLVRHSLNQPVGQAFGKKRIYSPAPRSGMPLSNMI